MPAGPYTIPVPLRTVLTLLFLHLRIPPFALYRNFTRVRARATPRVFSLLAACAAVSSYSA